MQALERLDDYRERRDLLRVVMVTDLTHDKIKCQSGEIEEKDGGPGKFVALVYDKLGVPVTMVAFVGADYKRSNLPHSVDLYPKESYGRKNITYDLNYTVDPREMSADFGDCCEFPTKKYLEENRLGYLTEDKDIFIISPLRPIPPATVNDFCTDLDGTLKVGIIQGWCRDFDADNKVISRAIGEIDKDIEEMKDRLDVIVFSNEDTEDPLSWGRKWSMGRDGKKGPVVVVTQNVNGCTIFVDGKESHIDGYHIDYIVDPTGAGDRFAAFFAFMYRVTDNWRASAQFANAATAYALQNGNDEIQLDKIFTFARDQDRPI